MRDRLFNLVIVTLAALLVWMYAEDQSVEVSDPMVVTLRIQSEDASDLFGRFRNATSVTGSGIDQTQLSVQIELEGSPRPLRNVASNLNGSLTLTLGRHGMPTELGPHTVALESVLRQHEMFNDRGITLRSVEPAFCDILVDRWETIELPIEAGNLGEIEADGPISFAQNTAIGRFPQSALRTANIAPEMMKAEAVLVDRNSLDSQPEGEPVTVEVRLTPSPFLFPDYRMTPATTQMTLTIKSKRVEITKRLVPVHIVLPAISQSEYVVEIAEPIISEVVLSGPTEVVTPYQSPTGPKLFGYVILSSDDLDRAITEKEVSFEHLPDSIRVLSPPFVAELSVSKRRAEPVSPGDP